MAINAHTHWTIEMLAAETKTSILPNHKTNFDSQKEKKKRVWNSFVHTNDKDECRYQDDSDDGHVQVAQLLVSNFLFVSVYFFFFFELISFRWFQIFRYL